MSQKIVEGIGQIIKIIEEKVVVLVVVKVTLIQKEKEVEVEMGNMRQNMIGVEVEIGNMRQKVVGVEVEIGNISQKVGIKKEVGVEKENDTVEVEVGREWHSKKTVGVQCHIMLQEVDRIYIQAIVVD